MGWRFSDDLAVSVDEISSLAVRLLMYQDIYVGAASPLGAKFGIRCRDAHDGRSTEVWNTSVATWSARTITQMAWR